MIMIWSVSDLKSKPMKIENSANDEGLAVLTEKGYRYMLFLSVEQYAPMLDRIV